MKKILTYIIILALAITSFLPFNVSADKNEINKLEYEGLVYEGYDIYYSDSYFKHNSTEYDSHLATISVLMSNFSMVLGKPKSANDKEWYENQPKRIKGFFDTIGYENFATNEDYRSKSSFDTIGLAAASKKVDDYTIIAIVPRSSGYFQEWANNIWLGDGSKSDYMHEGWYKAANKTIKYIDEYIESNNIEGKIKIWMTGYSRGGAIVNIAAGLIDNKLDKKEKVFNSNVTLDHNDLYTYTFEAPQGANYNSKEVKSPKDNIYNNIFNIVNPNDLVTKTAMVEYGFTRFGIDKYITTKLYDSANYESNISIFKPLLSKLPNNIDYKADDFVMYDVFSNAEIDITKSNYDANIVSILLLENLTKTIGSRKDYVSKYQTLLKIAIQSSMSDDSKAKEDDMENLFATIVSDILTVNLGDKANIDAFNLKTSKDFSNTFKLLASSFAPIAQEIPNELISIGVQGSNIFQNHEPDITIAHLEAQDTNYTSDLVPLLDNTDLYRGEFSGFNDLKYNKDQLIDNKEVKNKNNNIAVGYYNYENEEKIQLFIPVKDIKVNSDKLYMKSYSDESSHKIEFYGYIESLTKAKEEKDHYLDEEVNKDSETIERVMIKDNSNKKNIKKIAIIIIVIALVIVIAILSTLLISKKTRKH